MDAPKGREERIEAAVTEAYESICNRYKERYLNAVEAYIGPHKTLADCERAARIIDELSREVQEVSDSCINDVDVGLKVLYHGIQYKKEEKVIRDKRKEMKNWPLPFKEADVEEALKSIAEATKRKTLNEQALDYYLRDGSD